MLKLYLAGAIRDNHPEDETWRNELINTLKEYEVLDYVCVLNPLGGKDKNAKGEWTSSGYPCLSRYVVQQDFWCVERADILIFNFLALKDHYPNLGTLIEFGHSTAKRQLRFVIWPSAYLGHENEKMFDVHPFILENSTAIFSSVKECTEYLINHLKVLTGVEPRSYIFGEFNDVA